MPVSATTTDQLRPLAAPFPYFGGKRRAAELVWSRFGDCNNYIEPFFGSGAVLLGRPPGFCGTEQVNDKDCYLANFWRALQADPAAVCRHCDWPVNEIDLHARHDWLLNQFDFRERMRRDHRYYDAEIAGLWVWGACQWIGSGWCVEQCYNGHRPSQQLPRLGDAGTGVHRPSQRLPHVGSAGKGVHRLANSTSGDLSDYLHALAARLRRVRVCCGDWLRVVKSPSVLFPSSNRSRPITAVFLDPPYSGGIGRNNYLYAVEDLTVSDRVREWAIEHGDDPRLRICLCGYDGEHKMPRGWRRVQGKAGNGYANRNKQGNANAGRERLWFSPHCLRS
jgi:hypothetical protein